jgi:hypothetical protein
MRKQFPTGEYVIKIDLKNYSKFEKIQITE